MQSMPTCRRRLSFVARRQVVVVVFRQVPQTRMEAADCLQRAPNNRIPLRRGNPRIDGSLQLFRQSLTCAFSLALQGAHLFFRESDLHTLHVQHGSTTAHAKTRRRVLTCRIYARFMRLTASMTADQVADYITSTYPDTKVAQAMGATFFSLT